MLGLQLGLDVALSCSSSSVNLGFLKNFIEICKYGMLC